MKSLLDFFINGAHYSTLEDIEVYLGNKDFGAFSVMSKIYYEILGKYLPEEIEVKLGEEDDPFDHPKYPYYYKAKNDGTIDDGMLNVLDKKSFSEFTHELMKGYKKNRQSWSIDRVDDFIENISRYAEEIDGYYMHAKFDISPKIATWRVFAQILKGANMI